ncbi:MAG: hypothetical protein ACXADA_24360 [Candidatus Hodarchaeales archaeon]
MKDREKGYLLLVDGSIHSESEEQPNGFFVRGFVEGDRFYPEGDIEGEGTLTTGSTGWLELSTGTFHGMQTSRPPFPPYIEGIMTPEGFLPSSRKINY